MRKFFLFALFAVLSTNLNLLLAQDTNAPQPTAPLEKARVFITDSESWEVRGSSGGANGVYSSQSHGGARPQTAEIIKTFGQRCPDVIINNKQDVADYIVVLEHEGGKGYLQHRNKVAVFERLSGDSVMSHSTLSLGGSVEDACNGIKQHWIAHSKEIINSKVQLTHPVAAAPVQQPQAPPPSPVPAVQATIAVESTPTGADIEIDGAFVGSTSSVIELTPGSHQVVIKKKGFADWSKTLTVTGGTIHLNAELEPAK
jgi:hypothetical protein